MLFKKLKEPYKKGMEVAHERNLRNPRMIMLVHSLKNGKQSEWLEQT